MGTLCSFQAARDRRQTKNLAEQIDHRRQTVDRFQFAIVKTLNEMGLLPEASSNIEVFLWMAEDLINELFGESPDEITALKVALDVHREIHQKHQMEFNNKIC